jgi:hypothetical protein
MTVSSETNKTTYAGNGSTSTFSTGFTFSVDAEVVVTLVASDATQTEWVKGTQYTLTGAGTGSAGSVAVVTSPTNYTPASGETLVIELKPAFTQTTSLSRGGTTSPKDDLEPMHDTRVRQILRVKGLIDGALVVPITETTIGRLPTSSDRASKYLTFDSSGNPTAAAAPADTTAVTTFMATVLDDTTASAALTTLGISTFAKTILDDANAAAVQTTIGALAQGLHTIFVPAGAMRPTASNGCATLVDVETTSGKPDMTVLDFDDGSDEHAQFQIAMPKNWNAGTITFQVYWCSTATDTDGVSWGLQGVSVADNSTIDASYGTAVVVDDANQGAAEELLVTAVSGDVTIASAADSAMTFFRIFRDTSDANDTATEDARLIGVKIFYTSSSADDS